MRSFVARRSFNLCDRRNGFKALVSTAFLFLACLSLLGCAGKETSSERALRRGPLPYHVGVFVDSRPAGGPSADTVTNDSAGDDDVTVEPISNEFPKEQVRYLLSNVELAGELEKSLRGASPVVSKVKVLSASDRQEALEAARGLDMLLIMTVAAPDEFKGYHPSPGWAALEIGFFLFGGVPSWFIPTLDFDTSSSLSIEGIDLHAKETRARYSTSPHPGSPSAPVKKMEVAPDWQQSLESKSHNVSLWGRSHPLDRPLDYLATVAIPPMFLAPGDPERLSKKLTAEVTSDWGDQLAKSLRKRLVEDESRKPLSVVFVSPDPLAPVAKGSLQLRLEIASRDTFPEGGTLRKARVSAMDVHRFANGARVFRWRAAREDLERLQEDLESTADRKGYARFDVPVEIGLLPGQNTIKVRILRDDGEQVTRTMVYSR